MNFLGPAKRKVLDKLLEFGCEKFIFGDKYLEFCSDFVVFELEGL
jgi:hypothetical protein